MGQSAHVGRIGALAVALGIGLAMTGAPAVAWADAGGETAANSSQRTVERPTDRQDQRTTDKVAERRKSRKNLRADDEPRVPKRHLRVSEPETKTAPTQDRVEPAQAPAEPTVTPQADPPAGRVNVPDPVAVRAPVTDTETPELARTPIVRTVLRAVSDAVAVGSGYGTQPGTPLLWGLMAWVRRQTHDGDAVSAAALAAANTAPVATGDVYAGVEDKTIKGNVLDNDTDPDGTTLVASVVAGPSYGVVTLSSNGAFVYTPSTNYHGVDTFSYTASDGLAASNIAVVSLTVAAVDDIVFRFTYGSGAQYWTPQAKAALQAAADRLSEYIATSSPVTLTYNVTGEINASATYLATGGTNFGVPRRPAFSNAMIKKVTSRFHTDANRTAADGNLLVNFSYPYYSYDDSPAANEVDFQTVVMHELLHSLGYQAVLDGGQTNRRSWLTYDKFIVDQSGTRVISSLGRFNGAFAANLSGADGGLFFGGANAVAAYGGPVPLQALSLSHLRLATFPYGGPNAKLMGPVAPNGKTLRVLSPVESAILRDLGYTVASPAPSVL
ncbi:Ig-like domain-containing protein [Mycobacterium sp. PSTR-4-N]|uniref:Ig-like domain-containing protein n=1 Tax=Mycobacterium sp. PSTR-4-N TaxID=2917745 RepID=UPI001F14F2A8|nr:Ig-like domain-containing protein [Mycobacterium sp. PSTR-4-N]MCG7594635.1 Ig-like domain-containing protein [Mycobacterium sp. PSTR-4-N]